MRVRVKPISRGPAVTSLEGNTTLTPLLVEGGKGTRARIDERKLAIFQTGTVMELFVLRREVTVVVESLLRASSRFSRNKLAN